MSKRITCIYPSRTCSGNNMMFLKSVFLLFTIQSVYSLSESDATKVINKSKSVVKGANLATMVRLTFHDCVGVYKSLLNNYFDLSKFKLKVVVMVV